MRHSVDDAPIPDLVDPTLVGPIAALRDCRDLGVKWTVSAVEDLMGAVGHDAIALMLRRLEELAYDRPTQRRLRTLGDQLTRSAW
jgi:hypothetical protein